MNDKYKEGEEYFEVTFDFPKEDEDDSTESWAARIMNTFSMADNIRVVKCKIIKEPRRLSVSKDDYSVTTNRVKQKSQIVK